MMCSTDWWESWVYNSLKAAPHSTIYGLLSMQRCSVLSLQCTSLKCTAPQCNLLYSASLFCTIQCCTVLHCTVLHCSALYSAALFCIVQCSTILHCTVLYCSALYSAALKSSEPWCTSLYFAPAVLQYTKLDCSDVQYMLATFIVPIGVSEWI